MVFFLFPIIVYKTGVGNHAKDFHCCTVKAIWQMNSTMLIIIIISIICVCVFVCLYTGDHTMQWLYGCGIADDSTIRSYNHYSVDGTDFLHLNTNNLNWTAFNEKAEIFKNNWDIKGHEAQHMISYLKTKCIDSLKEYVSHLNTSQKTGKVYDLLCFCNQAWLEIQLTLL